MYVLSNYRHVLNLFFLSEITETAITSELSKYLLVNVPNKTRQSAFKRGHSTETAPLRVMTDNVMSINQSRAVVLIVLDLSVLFDTADHNVLFSQLVKTVLLDWFASLLKESFVRYLDFAILGPAWFSSRTYIIHHVNKMIWYHCTAVWSKVSPV